jgi:hypothetical protein
VIRGMVCASWGLGLRYDPIWAQYPTCLNLGGMTTFEDCQKTLNMELGDAGGWWIVLVSAPLHFAVKEGADCPLTVPLKTEESPKKPNWLSRRHSSNSISGRIMARLAKPIEKATSGP